MHTATVSGKCPARRMKFGQQFGQIILDVIGQHWSRPSPPYTSEWLP